MAAGMEGQQRLLWWRRRWQGDGVGEVNLAATAADPAPEESGSRGDGGNEFAATAVRATMMGSLRRVPSELDDGEKGREDGEMAAGWKGSSGCGSGDRHHGRGRHGNLGCASRGRGRRPHPAGAAVFGGGVGGQFGVERHNRWQQRPARRERRERRRWKPAWRERHGRRWRRRPRRKGGAAGGCVRSLSLEGWPAGGRRCSDPTWRQRLSGGGLLV
ncbi:hypothetical protein OsI_04211 [Oryza sativa Indica Group]|uniref:Uncharacterized protein n=1 Tax=Oryza sativa subsp. indica TaxID=39946 RepID=A2WWD0_ORYSI|nr:hypothetical protein OsI_04211 [Oryza sativa Indica Group]